jgi:hypothetical protein
MVFTITGCFHAKPLPDVQKPMLVPICPPTILAEPVRTERPSIFLWYKIERGKEFFIMDRDGYISIRDYILNLEGSLDFSIWEIRKSNASQKGNK